MSSPPIHLSTPDSRPATTDSARAASAVAAGEKNADPRVLIIDDTPAIHQDFRKILCRPQKTELDEREAELFGESSTSKDRASFQVDSASQGKEGLALVEKAVAEGRRYVMAFVDIRMPPGWDGVETTEHLWAVDPDLQIVICTAYSDYSWDRMTERLGVTENLVILKKPFDTVEVLQLAHALARKWTLTQESKRHLKELNDLVRQRTAELSSTNEALVMDIARRQQTEEALRKAQERLSHVITQSPAVIYSLRTDEKSITPDWVSENMAALLGFSAAEACAPDWWAAHVHPEDCEQALASRNELFTAHKATAEYRLQHKNGDYRWVRDEQRLLPGGQGRTGEIIGTWTDISGQKELEAQLRHSQKMEAIGLLAGGVAHDFNNLLAVIRLNADLVMMTAGAGLEPQARNSLDQVTGAVERASNLTRQLLAFGRKQLMEAKPLNLNELIADLARMLVRLIGEHIKLSCEYAEELACVQADRGMIEQVLTNLVINSRDAMPEGGELVVRTEQIELDATACQGRPDAKPGKYVCFSVADTGKGISPEHMAHLFEPFFTTKGLGKGTGLGLATAYGIVKQHQGWIEVATQIGQGTVFKIFLPAAEATALVSAKEDTSSPRGGTETILLVEDETAVRSSTRRLLTSFGYQVHEANSGSEALEKWSSRMGEIDLLLTDMIMPNGVSGRDLIEALKKLKPGLKCIIMSGYSGDALKQEDDFLQRTGCRFLQKPCTWRQLIQAVRQHLDAVSKL